MCFCIEIRRIASKKKSNCKRRSRKKKANDKGQGTVEAAFTLPVLFMVVLLLIQPGIVLYDRLVMQAAAAEGCRLLVTKEGVHGSMDGACEAFVRHRLAAIPQHECFHVHEGGCSWDIKFFGDESADEVSVTIEGKLRPLPLLDIVSASVGATDDRGYLTIRVSASVQSQPAWVGDAPIGRSPSGWVGAWFE